MIESNSAARRCYENIQAWFTYADAPKLTLMMAMQDRCYFDYSPEFADWINQEAIKGLEGGGKFSTFFTGYRETVAKTCMEVLFHTDMTIEIDFDYFNPDYGLLYMALHGFECLKNKFRSSKTDPFKIANGLQKRGILL